MINEDPRVNVIRPEKLRFLQLCCGRNLAHDIALINVDRCLLRECLVCYSLVRMAKKQTADASIVKARKLFEQSGKSLDELGLEMGSDGETARKYAWQFLNKVYDPRISTLRKFSKAVGVPIEDIV